MAIRQSILERHKKGVSVSKLSREFSVSRRTVYTLLERVELNGIEGLRPDYSKCGRKRRDEKDFVFRAVRCLRTWHPSWGSEKIRAHMLRLRPGLKSPHYRSFNRWFHWNDQIEFPIKSRLPKPNPHKAKRLHEGWQIDAKEEMIIAKGSKNCWLNITDEYSGTVIDPPVFPPEENQ